MARAAWRGYLAIGQLGIPVRLYGATRSTAPQFVLLHEKDGSPVERVNKCRAERKEISTAETIRAVRHKDGQLIPLSDQELERAASSSVKVINVEQFSDTGSIDPIYFEKPYFLVAAKGGERAYALLREVLARKQKNALVRYFLYRREHLGLIEVYRDLLVMQQLRFANEIVPRSDLNTPALVKPAPNEIEALSAVVERYSSPVYIEDYHNTYEERLKELIERKARGLKAGGNRRLPPSTLKGDDELMDALRETLQTSEGLAAAKD